MIHTLEVKALTLRSSMMKFFGIPFRKNYMVDEIKRKNPKEYTLTGVEIGVWNGENAFTILKVLKPKKMYFIDPYESFDGFTRRWELGNDNYQKAKKNIKNAINGDKNINYEFILSTSESAAEKVPDNLDFVYIDGNHNYEFVKMDIEIWYKKVRNGGIIGGHNFEPGFSGVARAVVEFSEISGLEINGSLNDWWIYKKYSPTKNAKNEPKK